MKQAGAGPYLFGRPRVWVVFIRDIWIGALFLLIGWAGLTAAYWCGAIDRSISERGMWLVGPVGVGVQIVVLVRYWRHVRVKRSLEEHGQILCPACAYPVFAVDDPEPDRVCPECGSALHYDEVVRSWARVPDHRARFRELVGDLGS